MRTCTCTAPKRSQLPQVVYCVPTRLTARRPGRLHLLCYWQSGEVESVVERALRVRQRRRVWRGRRREWNRHAATRKMLKLFSESMMTDEVPCHLVNGLSVLASRGPVDPSGSSHIRHIHILNARRIAFCICKSACRHSGFVLRTLVYALDREAALSSMFVVLFLLVFGGRPICEQHEINKDKSCEKHVTHNPREWHRRRPSTATRPSRRAAPTA